MLRMLILDGDRTFAETLADLLQQAGFATLTAGSGQAGLTAFANADPDIVLLELNLPDISGFDLCRQLRDATAVPIIVVTESGVEGDKVLAFELGAADYVTKPFSHRELIARVTAVLRRYDAAGQGRTESVLTAGPIQMDMERHRVTVRGADVVLSLKDFTILAYLIRNRGHLVSRTRLIEQVWGEHFDGNPKRVDTIIARLRRQIEVDPGHPRHLLAVRGLGYRIDA